MSDGPGGADRPGSGKAFVDRGAVLGQVTDPDALAFGAGARGQVRIEVPRAWLAEAGPIELTVPVRLVCARCEGGGCDGCERSGAVRAAGDEAARTLRLELPRTSGGAALRIAEPFGLGGIAQLIVEVRPGARPSAGVRRCAGSRAKARGALTWAIPLLLLLLAMLVTVFLVR